VLVASCTNSEYDDGLLSVVADDRPALPFSFIGSGIVGASWFAPFADSGVR